MCFTACFCIRELVVGCCVCSCICIVVIHLLCFVCIVGTVFPPMQLFANAFIFCMLVLFSSMVCKAYVMAVVTSAFHNCILIFRKFLFWMNCFFN